MPRGFRSRGCKGRSPLHKKTKNLPLPAGKGGGGMGAIKQTKGRGGRRQRRHAPPLGTAAARSAGNQPGKPPAGRVIRAPAPVPPGFSPGDARGEAPCIRKQKISPFPLGRGAGGWGQQSKLKAGLAGDKQGKPPTGDSGGKVSRQPTGQAPLPPAGCVVRPLPPGTRGAPSTKPRRNNLLFW